MMPLVKRLAVPMLSVAAVMTALPAFADCRSSLDDFNRAIASRSLPDARAAESALIDGRCSQVLQQVRAQRVELTLQLVDSPTGPFRSTAEKEAALVEAAKFVDSWQAEAKLADLKAARRLFGEAVGHYDEAIRRIGVLGNVSAGEADRLISKAAAAKLLANDDNEGRKTVAFAGSRGPDGKVGGIFSPALRGARGVVSVSLPVPIQFETASTKLTPAGEKAFAEMFEALRDQAPKAIKLIGHADPRGADDYNMKLSEQRVKAVGNTLLKMGLKTDITVEWRGKRDPFDISVLPYQPTPDEILALDRRVELVLPSDGQ